MKNVDEIDQFRTVPKAVEFIHEMDEESAVTMYQVRKGIRAGQLRANRIGRKYYTTVRAIYDYYGGQNNG